MPNSLLTGQMVCNEFLRLLGKDLGSRTHQGTIVSCGAHGRPHYKDGWRLGDTVRIRGPVSFSPSGGFFTADIVEPVILVVLQHELQRSFVFAQNDLALSLDQLSRRVMQSAAWSMAQEIFKLWARDETLVVARLTLPQASTGQGAYVATDADSGLSIRYTRAYDVKEDLWISSVDILFGVTGVPVAQDAQPYQPSPVELEIVALLMEAMREYAAELEERRAA